MPIESNQILFMRPQTISDSDSNGGRISATEIPDGVKNNVWPDVPSSERTAGSTKYRKTFIKIASPDNLKLIDARVFVETPTLGGDRVVIFPATQTDTQGTKNATPTQYGCGWLNANVSVGAFTLQVNVENAADVIFIPNQLIRISNKASVNDSYGVDEFVRIKNDPSGVSWSGNLATLTLATGVTLENAFLASNTKVASVIEAGDIWAKTDTWGVSSPAGTYGGWNGTGSAPTTLTDLRMVDHIAGIEQTWTITFTSATDFTCVGDTVGSVGTGSKTSGFAPNNPNHSRPYFTLPSNGWGGTWATGNILSFKSHPSAVPIWEKRIIPPNTPSLAGNRMVVAIIGESE